jgi:uncharacterized membrane protein
MTIKNFVSFYSVSLILVSILSAYIFNAYNNITLQIILYIGIAIIPFILNDTKQNEFPLIIYCVSLSLLLSSSLISNYIWGWDINFEYKNSNNVLMNNYWDINYKLPVNSMLTIVILSPILSIFSNVNLIWIFKIVYPIIFALVPVVAYLIYSKVFDKKIAAFSTLFLIFTITFYSEMLQLARQETAELIMILICYVYITKYSKEQIKKFTPILLLLLTTIVISHYALTYLFLFVLITSYFMISLLKRYKLINLNYNIPIYHIVFLTIITFSWYTYTSLSINIVNIIDLITQMTNSILTDLFNLQKLQALSIIISPENEIIRLLYRIIILFSQTMIVLGVIVTINKYRKNLNIYHIISIIFLTFLIFNLFIPYLSSSLNTTRIYHISLLILSPYAIIGLITGKNIKFLSKYNKYYFKIISLLLVIYFCFNNGLVYYTFSIDNSWITLKTDVDFPIFTKADVISSNWFIKNNNEQQLYADVNRINLFWSKPYDNINVMSQIIPENSIIYISNYNVIHNTLNVENNTKVNQIKYNFSNLDLIYNNENSKIFSNQEILTLFK